MSRKETQGSARSNSRLKLSQLEEAAVVRLVREARERANRREAELADGRRLAVKRALSAATRELFAKNRDFRALAEKLSDQLTPDALPVRGGGDVFDNPAEAAKIPRRLGLVDRATEYQSYVEIREWLRLRDRIGEGPAYLVDPPFARELWWGETHPFQSGSGLNIDIEGDPCRIWGHIAYDSDPLRSGSIGVAQFYFLTPDRFPVRGGSNFEIRPRLQIGGWASGWTGLYHPVWHADDKWSKCWQNLRVTASLSSGEVLDSEVLHFNLFDLEDVYGVGQANASLFMGWVPVLSFAANLADLRARGVSIILEAEWRYDYQLEGESDLWLRNRTGSDAESPASFDNAATLRVFPGSVLSV